MTEFLKELAALLLKHNARIGFNADGGDTHGLGAAGIDVTFAEGEYFHFKYGWEISHADVAKAWRESKPKIQTEATGKSDPETRVVKVSVLNAIAGYCSAEGLESVAEQLWNIAEGITE